MFIKVGAMKHLLLFIYGAIVLTIGTMELQFESYTTLELYIMSRKYGIGLTISSNVTYPAE
jgi:hypothetical protein